MNTYKCKNCSNTFTRSKKDDYHNRHGKSKNVYCSMECFNKHKTKTKTFNFRCKYCKRSSKKWISQKGKNNFCSSSCAAKFNSCNKKFGTRVSKLELWLQEQLVSLYPNLEIHFNRKDAINSELDIYIPSLKLAFELNGIFHYEPIFGKEKLSQIKNNDQRKFQACIESDIELCIIDTSQQKYFKPKSSQKYLDIIIAIINNK